MRSILNSDPADRITTWIPACAGMTGLVFNLCSSVSICGEKKGFDFAQPAQEQP
jgi:hypothetical protein